MVPTPELRTRLRKLLDERIPESGRDTDTRLLDEDLDEILLESANVFAAAAMGWTMKAGMLQSEMGDVERLTLGQETEQLVSLRDRVTYALGMAERYASMAKASRPGSVMLRVKPAEEWRP
jgi:hypothetical protein